MMIRPLPFGEIVPPLSLVITTLDGLDLPTGGKV